MTGASSSSLSSLAISILGFFAGPTLQDAVIGDLEERYMRGQHSRVWYWTQTVKSIPSLCWMHIRGASAGVLAAQALFLCAVLCLITIYELGIARAYSWPIAQSWLDYSPLSAGNTCRAAYIGLYSGFIVALLTGFSTLGKHLGQSPHFRMLQSILIALAATLPIIYLTVFPLPTDGSVLFRASQFAGVWAVVILCCVVKMTTEKRQRVA